MHVVDLSLDLAESAPSYPPPTGDAGSAKLASSDSRGGPADRSGGETILLVEDQEPLRAVVARILGEHGYSILEARNPMDALELCRGGERIDLLLTDVVMPEMNGRELARRALEVRPNLRVLFMSGYTGTALAPEETGTQLLNKPFTPKELLQMVRQALA
jgi:CheY-like chemotaxis protein